ncbi:hypothetical protein [Nitratireductor pacificus]|uniref:Uncharacterized protein n=1 Tax=Nitratireductor pacificus pht-3B TaxID=391937 RepID=K2MI22_9HYPH|nr:hypothetical protein [Nitratireductor pacificus]EKF20375.1 hypothetical protein NA2_03937 [Nitratireductor pacificus pht-3B]
MRRGCRLFAPAGLAGLILLTLASVPANALSELEQAPPLPKSASPDSVERVPLPPPVETPSAVEGEPAKETDGEEALPSEDAPARDALRPDTGAGKPAPEIHYDLDKLPEPVRRMHGLIVEACKSGDLEALRPLIGMGESMTQLSLGGLDGDPLEFLRELSGDGEGQEILAILLEVLQAGYVHLDAGTPAESYVWPYFFALPLETLDKRQRVELFKLVTAGDYEDMKNFGAYIFYRVGITPEGRWAFFVAGD